jgi:hypothetical protein
MQSDPLTRVRRAARARTRAEAEYRAAIVSAVDALEENGTRHPFSTVASVAGVARQSVRELVQRARG